MSTYDLSFVAEVSGVAAGLAKIPKMTEQAAAKSALAQVTASRKAAQKAAKDQEDAAKKAAGGWSNAFKGLAKVAGFGELTEKAGALSGGMEGAALASGVAVAGIAAVGVAALGAAAGTVKLMRGAREAIEQIDRLGVTDIITDTQRENIADANASLDAIGVGAGAVTAAMASGLAPAVERLSVSLVSLELFAAKAAGTFSAGALTFDYWSVALLFALTPVKLAIDGLDMLNRALGISNPGIESSAALVDGWAVGLADAAVSVQANTAAQKESLSVSTDGAKAIEQVGIANDKTTESYKRQQEAIKRETEAYREEMDVLGELGKIGQKAGEDQLDAAAQLAVARDDELVKINEIEAKGLAAAKARGNAEDELTAITKTAAASRSDVEARYARDTASAKYAIHIAVQDAIAAADDADMAAFKTRIAEHDKLEAESNQKAIDHEALMADLRAQAAASIIDAAGVFAGLAQDAFETKVSQLQAEMVIIKKNSKSKDATTRLLAKIDEQDMKERIKRQKTAALVAFRASQGVAIAGAAMSGAQAYLGVMAAMAMTGPASPALAAAITVPPTLAQIGIIAAQKPPKFARGGVITETEAGEGIANKRAMADPKFRRALDGANMGQSSGGGGNTDIWLNDRLLMTIYGRMKRLAGEAVPNRLTRGMA